MSAADELTTILRNVGLQDFMDERRLTQLAQDLLEQGVRTPIQFAMQVSQGVAARIDRNDWMVSCVDCKQKLEECTTEADELRARVADYESAIGWNLACTNCAHLMDQNYNQYTKIETLKEKLAELLAEL